MIRLFGAVFLVVGSSALGMGAVLRLNERVQDLSGVIRGLESMKRSLLSSMVCLEDMLAEAENNTQGRPNEFFSLVHKEMEGLNSGTFSELWQRAVESAPLRCLDLDLSELRSLGGILGSYDADSQAAALGRVITNLDARLDDAREKRGSLGRVYGTMGASAGLLLAILLM